LSTNRTPSASIALRVSAISDGRPFLRHAASRLPIRARHPGQRGAAGQDSVADAVRDRGPSDGRDDVAMAWRLAASRRDARRKQLAGTLSLPQKAGHNADSVCSARQVPGGRFADAPCRAPVYGSSVCQRPAEEPTIYSVFSGDTSKEPTPHEEAGQHHGRVFEPDMPAVMWSVGARRSCCRRSAGAGGRRWAW
jgi:hypothetical protein